MLFKLQNTVKMNNKTAYGVTALFQSSVKIQEIIKLSHKKTCEFFIQCWTVNSTIFCDRFSINSYYSH